MATVLAFHAHPDDEVLLTGGTLARLAAEGNRVVVVMATDGVMGRSDRAGLIHEEHADVLLSYDQQGGHGHRDHVKVHAIGARAAQMAGVRVHQSYVGGSGRTARLGRAMVAPPVPIFGLLLGREWFAEPGAAATTAAGDMLHAGPHRPPGSDGPAPSSLMSDETV